MNFGIFESYINVFNKRGELQKFCTASLENIINFRIMIIQLLIICDEQKTDKTKDTMDLLYFAFILGKSYSKKFEK